VYVTIRSIQALPARCGNLFRLADCSPTRPLQYKSILLHLPASGNGCKPARALGSTRLPAGDYQQIRLFCLPTQRERPAPSNEKERMFNDLGGDVFNCGWTATRSRNAEFEQRGDTGLKIPPGRLWGPDPRGCGTVGGPEHRFSHVRLHPWKATEISVEPGLTAGVSERKYDRDQRADRGWRYVAALAELSSRCNSRTSPARIASLAAADGCGRTLQFCPLAWARFRCRIGRPYRFGHSGTTPQWC